MRAKNYYPQTTNVNKNPKSSGSLRTLFLAFIMLIGIPAVSFAAPTLTYTQGNTQGLSICENVNTNLSTNLQVNYAATGTLLTWSLTAGPAHGTVTGSPFSRTSTNPTTAPNGTSIHYTPTTGYVGTDAIAFSVTDGSQTITTVISVTVNATPGAIAGPTTVCSGQTITLSNSLTGGVWSSSSNFRATVGSTSGVVTGGSSFGPSPTITYTTTGGCAATTVITVNPLSPITGAHDVCAYGATITLNDATNGGTWTAIGAPVTPAGGFGGGEILTPQAAGPVSISYIMPTGCTATTTLTVNPLPDPVIGGPAAVCVGSSVSLSDQTNGGTWSSSNNGKATVGSATGVVTGVGSFGTRPVISYTLPTGCAATTTITVNPLPNTIGTNSACLNQTLVLTDIPAGGTWSSSSTTVLLTSSGSITGLVSGTALVTYTLPTGCLTSTTITINPLPGPITGTTTVCQGSTTTLSDTTAGGTWTSANNTIANVGSASGIVSSGPGTGGTTNIIYTLPTGCSASTSVTVYQLGTISGSTNVCIGATTALTDAPGGGTWGSSNANATINLNSGVVTGVSGGTTTITYTTLNGCVKTRTETIDSLPTLSGGSVCVGAELILPHSPVSGTWSSSNTSVATIRQHSFQGHVHGVAVGVDTITYTSPAGCIATTTVVVNAIYPIIGSSAAICVGFTVSLSDSAAGGTWSSNNTTIATVDAGTGVVTAVSQGSATITYATPSGCTATKNITVNPNPGGITGTFSVCQGRTATLYDLSTPGGAWSSSSTAIATVQAIDATSASVSGVSGGVVNITYTLGTGCYVDVPVTVNSIGTISGILFACRGTQTTLSETQPGQWAIDPLTPTPVTASVDPTTGVVTGNSNNGPTVIDFITTVGACVATTTVTVGSLPAITGPSSVCAGSSISLSDVVSGGTWSSSNTNSIVNPSTGVVTGETGGNSNIVYTLVPGCSSAPKTITVNALPVVTTGASVCVGAFVTLAHTPIGGTWSSSNTSIATVNPFLPNPGRVNGVSAGIDSISYHQGGCITTVTVLVNPTPGPIIGNRIVCPGISTTLSDTTAGGVWTSSNTTRFTIGSASGIATGVATGGFGNTVRYTLPTGCAATANFTVTNNLNAIQGATRVCMGQSINLSDVATGGAWSSMDPAVGAVGSSSGVVTGLSAGTTIVTYSLGTGCSAIHSVAVDALSPIVGATTTVCVGFTISLSDTTFGGHWTSSNTSVATINASTGLVTGVNGGTAGRQTVISYILPTGCTATTSVTVNPLPTAIAGIGAGVCLGSTKTLSDGIAGGTWSSSDTTIATIDSVSGVVSTRDSGTVIITYALPTGCTAATASLTVNPLPVLTSTLTPPAICNNTLFNYVPTSDMPGVDFEWQRNPVFGISNGLTHGSDSTGGPSSLETLHDTTVNPVAVSYAYTLQSIPAGCVSYDTVVVIVNPTPVLTSGLTPAPVCDSSLFTYISTSSSASVTYTWHRDSVAGISNSAADGIGDTIREVLVNTTTDPIVVTYMDSLWYGGCDNVQLVTVTVNPRPMLSSPLTNGAICDSTLFVYVPTSLTHDSSFTWHRGFTPGIANPPASGVDTISEILVNMTPNPIVVTYIDTITAFGCSNTQSVTVTVNPRPRLSSPVNPPAICDSTLFNYPPTSLTTGTTFNWRRPYIPGIGLLGRSGTGNPNEVLINTTNIDVTVTYIYTLTANGCSDSQVVRVVVHPRPELNSATGPFTVCSGSEFIYGPTNYVAGTTYAWTRAAVDGISPRLGSGTGNIIETLTDSTLTAKTVTYVLVMTANGCSNSVDISLTVEPSAGVPPFSTYPPQTLCLNTMFQNFGVATPAPEGVQYIWSAKNARVWATGNPNQYALVSFDSSAGPAVVTVKSNVTGVNCIAAQSYYLNIGPSISDNPQVIYADGQFMCLQNLEASYQWGFDDAITLDSTLIPGETNQTYFLSGPDVTYRNYWVMTTQTDGCTQKTYYNIPSAVNNVNKDVTDIKIYPNPANDIVNVDINTSVAGKYEVEVLDVLGQKINMVPTVNHKAQINVAHLASGVYLIDCYRDGVKINSARFVKN